MAENWEEHAESGLRQIAQRHVRTIEEQESRIRDLETEIWRLQQDLRDARAEIATHEFEGGDVLPFHQRTA
jgi:hypothetical protein